MLLFKLHAARNFIVGGEFFTRFVHLPISLSREAFGVRSLSEMREGISKYRRLPIPPMENPKVGCIRPRLGQGTARVIVTDAYERRCAITSERTLAVLGAAHIKPYSSAGPHEPEKGLLMRGDLYTLFDQGYLTIDADQLKVIVSSRIREEFENRRDYYHLHGRAIRLPRETDSLPSREYLAFHNSVFR
jgi:hypothetical protein